MKEKDFEKSKFKFESSKDYVFFILCCGVFSFIAFVNNYIFNFLDRQVSLFNYFDLLRALEKSDDATNALLFVLFSLFYAFFITYICYGKKALFPNWYHSPLRQIITKYFRDSRSKLKERDWIGNAVFWSENDIWYI